MLLVFLPPSHAMFMAIEPTFTAIFFALVGLWYFGVLGRLFRGFWYHAVTRQDPATRYIMVCGLIFAIVVWNRQIILQLDRFSRFLDWWRIESAKLRIRELEEDIRRHR